MTAHLTFDVVVEVPQGSRNKYETDPDTGELRLDRVLFPAVRYPAEYGYVVDTLAGDCDPLDALVIVDEPTFPGCRIDCRAIGLLRMRDQHGRDVKVLALPTFDTSRRWKDVGDVPEDRLREIHHFFDIYKDLDRDAFTHVEGWSGRAKAEQEIVSVRKRYLRSRSM